jgi:hypothetical protein
VHIFVVAVVVSHTGVMQLVVAMRRVVPMLMHVSVLVAMRVAVGMLMHSVAVPVRMAMGVGMFVGVVMLVRMAVRLVVAMAVFVVAVWHSRVSGTG